MKAKYALVGSGRMARHWTRYFQLQGIPLAHWCRASSTTLISEKSVSSVSKEDLQNFEVVFLAVSDTAIENVAAEIKGPQLIHFSGSHYQTDVLGMHPLAAFSDQFFDLEFYQKIPLIVDQKVQRLRQLVPELKNSVFEIRPEVKASYHAHCVMAGNFSTMLWQKLRDQFSAWQIPREHLEAYMTTISKNILEVEQPLTGPLVRQDEKTIRKHLETLEQDPFQKIYQSFCEVYCKVYKEMR